MAATVITRDSNNYFTLATPRGKHVEVYITGSYAAVFIRRNGMGRGGRIRAGECVGRHFHADSTQEAILKAIDAYKSADIKAALRALLSDLL